MRSFRSKPVGWRQDNYRHYLAAKYGNTNRFFAFRTEMPEKGGMKDITEYMLFNDVTPRHKYRLFVREMPPEEFLEMTKSSDPASWKYSQSEWESVWRDEEGRRFRDEEKISALKKAISEKKKIVPVPQLVYDAEGNLEDWQEGRHRGIAARELGMKTMPVAILVKRTRGDRALDDPETRLPLSELESGTDYAFAGGKFGWEAAGKEENQ